MSATAYINGRILLADGSLAHDKMLVVSGRRIEAVMAQDGSPDTTSTVDLNGDILAPGFIDVQVNGGGGALFNDAPSVETLKVIGAAHARFGTTSFLPTLISDDLEKIREGYRAVNAAIAEGVPGVIGIHVEGPFLNVERKGIHDASKIRPLDDGGMEAVLSGRPEVTLLTLAPECMSAAQVRALADAGILIFAGHSEASYADMQSAFAAGVIGTTHLFNAMSQLTGREPGVVGAALGNPDCWCCIIVDGQHVHPETLRLALRAKDSLDRFLLVTDAMPTVGQQNKRFTLHGEVIQVRDGVCRSADGTLAGSDLDMASAVANASKMLGLDGASALKLATANPAAMLRLSHSIGALAPGYDADMIQLSAAGVVERTWIKGQLIWDRSPS